jgi:cholesterol transport system auxiliary component
MKMRFFFLIMAMIFTAGCAVKMPQITTYSFIVPTPPINAQPPRTHSVLLVSTMSADPAFKNNNMIYVKNPGDLRNFSVNAWVAPPAQMFVPLIVQHLEAKNYFRAVVTPPFMGQSDYRLDTRLIILQQEFYGPQSEVRCLVEAVLTRGENGHVVASRRFLAIVPAPGNNPASGAAAANRAASQISEEIADFVITNLPTA